MNIHKMTVPEMMAVEGGTYKRITPRALIKNAEHFVSVNDFSIAKYPVTVKDFAAFVKKTNYITTAETAGAGRVWNGSTIEESKSVSWKHDFSGRIIDEDKEDHPVLRISNEDAEAYCNELKRITGRQYRLPTEAEWEYAARGGRKSRDYRYSGGNDPDAVGWYRNNSDGTTHPVGALLPNELGLHDMSGNCWERCSDFFEKKYFKKSPPDNPKGPESGDFHVIRGGAFYLSGPFMSLAFRTSDDPLKGRVLIGFRVAY